MSMYIIYRSKNHLIQYVSEQNQLNIKYYSGINKTTEKVIPIDRIVSHKLETRIYDMGFDVLSIKYKDERDLYELLQIRLSKKEDWVDILSLIKNSTEIR